MMTPMITRRFAPLMALVVPIAALALGGCGEADAQAPVRIAASDLECADHDVTLDIWESASWPPGTCDWLLFDGRTTLEVEHPLGRAPKLVLIYIAFDAAGTGATLGHGDSGIIDGATDTTITVKNDTRQRFYVRLVAQ